MRVHPINDFVSNVVTALPLLFVGFSPVAFAAHVPVLTLYAMALGELRALREPTSHQKKPLSRGASS